MNRTSGFLLGRILAVATVGVAAFVVVIALFDGGGCGSSTIMRDQNKLRQIAALCVVMREMPTRDGFFDPYEFVRNGTITQVNFGLFRSERLDLGPTDAEIERGDYTNFPWDRCRGEGRSGPSVFPLLWERRPGDKHDGRLVAFSDGSARYCERPEFVLRRIAGLVAQSGRLPMSDGAFDPYAFVREGFLPAELMRPGPTDAEIARGDYTNFPWERYRGNGALRDPPFALLWQRSPDEYGITLVGLSDGTVTSRR